MKNDILFNHIKFRQQKILEKVKNTEFEKEMAANVNENCSENCTQK